MDSIIKLSKFEISELVYKLRFIGNYSDLSGSKVRHCIVDINDDTNHLVYL